MEFNALLQQIQQQQFQPNYLLVGEETYLQSVFLTRLSTSLKEKEELDATQIDLNEASLTQVLDEAELYSFFAEYRLIMVENVSFLNAQSNQKISDSEQKRLENYLNNPNPNTIIVWRVNNDQLDKRKKMVKLFQKSATVVNVSVLEEKEVKDYVLSYIKQNEMNMSQQALDVLLERVQFSLSTAMNEIAKLINYALSGQQVTVEVVEQLVPRVLESNIFALTNALMARNASLAIQIYQDLLLMKHEPIAILALLISQFRIIIQATQLATTGQLEQSIASQLGIHPYRVKLALQSARQYSLTSIIHLYRQLIEADYQLKTSIGDKETFFYLIVTKFMMM